MIPVVIFDCVNVFPKKQIAGSRQEYVKVAPSISFQQYENKNEQCVKNIKQSCSTLFIHRGKTIRSFVCTYDWNKCASKKGSLRIMRRLPKLTPQQRKQYLTDYTLPAAGLKPLQDLLNCREQSSTSCHLSLAPYLRKPYP